MGPKDATNREIKSVPAKWIKKWSRSKPGKCYYFNDRTGECTWARPSGTIVEAPEDSSVKEVKVPHKRKSDSDSASNQKKPKTLISPDSSNCLSNAKPVAVQHTKQDIKLDRNLREPLSLVCQESDKRGSSTESLIIDNVNQSKCQNQPDSSSQSLVHQPPQQLFNKTHLAVKVVPTKTTGITKKKKRSKRKRNNFISSEKILENSHTTSSANSTNRSVDNVSAPKDTGAKSIASGIVPFKNASEAPQFLPTVIATDSIKNADYNGSSRLTVPKCSKSFETSNTESVNTVKNSNVQYEARRNEVVVCSNHPDTSNKTQKSPKGAIIKGTAEKRLKRLKDSFYTKNRPSTFKSGVSQLKNSDTLLIPSHPKREPPRSEAVVQSFSDGYVEECEAKKISCPAGKRLAQLQSKLKSDQNRKKEFLPNSMLEPPTSEVAVQPFSDGYAEECEAMEVDFMEAEVLFNIGELRQRDVMEMNQQPIFMDVEMDYSINQSDSNAVVYIVLDTNILLSHLNFTTELRDMVLPERGLVHLYLPWQVLQELDHLKDRGKTSVQALARRAINYLHNNFSSKHPRVRGQRLVEVTPNSSSCADDNILQACLQLKEQGCNVILLSNDTNLRNKALVCDVSAVSKDELSMQLSTGGIGDCSANDIVQVKSSLQRMITGNSKILEDSILSELKTIIGSSLTEVVSRGMEGEYQHLWKKRCVVPPPWSSDAVLRCLCHHWLPICGDFIPPLVRNSIEKLRNFLASYVKCGQLNLSDTKECLLLSKAVFKTLGGRFKDIVDIAIPKFEELEKRLSSGYGRNNHWSFGTKLTKVETDQRDHLVLTCFEEAHNAAMQICSHEALADPDFMNKALCMMGAVQKLLHLLTSLLEISVVFLREEDPVVNELLSLIKGSNIITTSDLVSFFKKAENRTLIQNGILQFASFEAQLADKLRMNS